jgi:hypothetical protein
VPWLDRYAAGRFDEVVADLSRFTAIDKLLGALKRETAVWISAGGPADRDRRRLAAATFALEAARVEEWHEWRWIQKQPPMGGGPGGSYTPHDVLYWRPPPLLVEFGCALLREDVTPRPVERWWQLAALAVAQRSEDFEFLIGDPFASLDLDNVKDEIKHLEHAQARFPAEPRFNLAMAIAVEWKWPSEALKAFDALKDDPNVGAEAMMRAGHVMLRRSAHGDAVKLLDRADGATRDRYVVYLARYFKGLALQRQNKLPEAERAFRGATATIPHAQAATVALATLLFKRDQRGEAQRLAAGMIAADPPPIDPWRAYLHADDRFWPQLIGRLRAQIQR